jgi:hypothetical protein
MRCGLTSAPNLIYTGVSQVIGTACKIRVHRVIFPLFSGAAIDRESGAIVAAI